MSRRTPTFFAGGSKFEDRRASRAAAIVLRARHGRDWLSTGMNADFEIAIRPGTTDARIAAAMFGRRPVEQGAALMRRR